MLLLYGMECCEYRCAQSVEIYVQPSGVSVSVFEVGIGIRYFSIVYNSGLTRPQQGHREFPFWKRKIPPAKEKIPENSRSVKCLILYALIQ